MTEAPSEDLGIGDYVALFRRRWRWLASSLLVVVTVVAVITITRDEVYESNASILLLTEGNTSLFNVRNQELFRTGPGEIPYFEDDAYLAAVNAAVGFETDITAELRFVFDGQETDEATVISVTAQADTAVRAQDAARAASEIYLADRVAQITQALAERRQDRVDVRDDLAAERTEINVGLQALADAANSASDPVTAAASASTYELEIAEQQPRLNNLSSRIGSLNTEITGFDTLLATLEAPESTARLLSAARLPDSPVSPDVARNLLAAGVVGLVLGAILAVFRDLLDNRARDGSELARLVDIPVMATIGQIRSQRSAPGGVRRFAELSAEESSGYQVLLNSLWLTNVSEPLQSIVFTSDRQGVGKTQTVVNLAQAEAARGTRVLIIDTDFVNPSIAARLDLTHGEQGLGELLAGTAAFESVVMATSLPTLHVIDAVGQAGAADLLRSDRFRTVLADLSQTYDLILIDAMPTLSTSDSRLVASQADAAVVVYDPAESRSEDLQHTIDLLRGSGANLIGLVANRSRASHPVYLSARER